MNNRLKLVFASALLLWPIASQAQTAKDLEGCWTLNSLVIERKGERIEPFGPKPIGQLIYTPDKHASVFQMRPDLPQGVTGDPTTPDDRIVQTYVAYVGTYTLDGKNLAVKVNGATRADWRNTTRVNTVEKLTPSELVLVNEGGDQKVTQSATRCSAR